MSKESPRFPWNSKGSLTCFKNFRSFLRYLSPHEGMLSFPPQSRRAPFSLPQIEIRVNCPASPGTELRRTCHTSRGGWYLLDTGWNPGASSKFESHVFPHPLEIRPDFVDRFECQLRVNSQQEGSSDAPVANPKRATGP